MKQRNQTRRTPSWATEKAEPVIQTFPEEHRHGCAKAIQYYETDDGCWQCVSHTINARKPDFPYFPLHRNGRTCCLHRYVFKKAREHDLQNGETIRPRCGNPYCINPDHMELGLSKYACGIKRRKLTMSQARRIRTMRLNGKPVKALAIRFDVSVSTIYNIIRNRTYVEDVTSEGSK